MGFKDRKRQAELEAVAKERGIAAVVLSEAILGRMTPAEKRPFGPEHVGVLDPQRNVVLSYAWVVAQYNAGDSTAGMAEKADITPIEMMRVLDDYGLQDCIDTHHRCGRGRRG